jgi:hypothetical protein
LPAQPVASIVTTPSRQNASRRKGIITPASLPHMVHGNVFSARHQSHFSGQALGAADAHCTKY